MRVRPQSYFLPAALLICLFFCNAAHSEKKNRVYGEDADRGVNFYKDNYKKKAAGGDRDIISCNSNPHSKYEDINDTKELSKSSAKKGSGDSSSLKRRDSDRTSSEQTQWYIVKKGDTLFGIAGRSGVPVKYIQDINNISNNSKIYIGMKLKVPAKNRSYKIPSESKEKNSVSSKPLFLWPLKKVKGYSNDGKDGVRSIGIIIKGSPGDEVVASDDGIVKRVGYMRGYGKYIVVKHDNRYITVYSNLMDVDVKTGDAVQRGGKIGNISDDMMLHFQIDRAGKPENPISLLPKRG